MSFGDRHVHQRLGERIYDRAMRDPRFQALLARGFATSFDYDIPYLGGYSRDGSVIYVDRDTPAAIQRGRRAYAIRPHGLVNGILIHEHWEKTALAAWGFDYDAAHELATHAEHRYVRDRLGLDPTLYEEIWRAVIRMAERKLGRRDVLLPPDLDLTPYSSVRVVTSVAERGFDPAASRPELFQPSTSDD